MNKINYAATVGKLRALESEFLRHNDLERLLMAHKAENILDELSQTIYGDHIAKIKNVSEFEILLNMELSRTYSLIKEFSLDSEITDLFFLRKDLHNLKVILKNSLKQKQCGYFSDSGLFPVALLQEMAEKKNYTKLAPWFLDQAVGRAVKEVELTGAIESIDFILDQAFYESFFKKIKIYENSFLERLLKIEIDTINLKTIVRSILMKKDKSFLTMVWLPNGELSIDSVWPETGEDENKIPYKIHSFRYRCLIICEKDVLEKQKKLKILEQYEKIFSLGLASRAETHTFTYLEKLVDDFIIQYIKQAKYTAFGIEPLIAYLWAKEMEIKNLRFIIVGKMAELPLEKIRQGVREVYV